MEIEVKKKMVLSGVLWTENPDRGQVMHEPYWTFVFVVIVYSLTALSIVLYKQNFQKEKNIQIILKLIFYV